jgi:hypothetical protein
VDNVLADFVQGAVTSYATKCNVEASHILVSESGYESVRRLAEGRFLDADAVADVSYKFTAKLDIYSADATAAAVVSGLAETMDAATLETEMKKNMANPPTAFTAVESETGTSVTDAVTDALNAVTDLVSEASGSACFAGSAMVETSSGFTSMSALRNGDVVRTASGFEPVVGFLHADAGSASFIELTTSSSVLPVSADHMMFLANGEAVPAASIKVGDVLSSGVVTSIEQVERDGVYAPLTKSGTIVVEGTVASCYAAAHEALSHSVSHMIMTPMRMLGFSSTSTSVVAPMAAVPVSA